MVERREEGEEARAGQVESFVSPALYRLAFVFRISSDPICILYLFRPFLSLRTGRARATYEQLPLADAALPRWTAGLGWKRRRKLESFQEGSEDELAPRFRNEGLPIKLSIADHEGVLEKEGPKCETAKVSTPPVRKPTRPVDGCLVFGFQEQKRRNERGLRLSDPYL